jgi:hypothetical protein
LVESSLDFSGRGRNLPQKKVKSMVEGSLDFSGRGSKISNGSTKRKMVDPTLDFSGRGRVIASPKNLQPSGLDFVSLGRQQTQNISKMVEKSTGVPMVDSITTTTTGKGKKKKIVSVKTFKAPKTAGKKTLGEANIDIKQIVEGIKKFNKAGEGLGKKLAKKKVKEPTRSEKALDQILEKSQPIQREANIELSADQLTQRRLRQLIDEEKAKKKSKGILARFRR